MVRGILKFNPICPTGVKFVLIRILSIFSKLVTKTTFNNNTKDTRSILFIQKNRTIQASVLCFLII